LVFLFQIEGGGEATVPEKKLIGESRDREKGETKEEEKKWNLRHLRLAR